MNAHGLIFLDEWYHIERYQQCVTIFVNPCCTPNNVAL